MRGLAVAVGMLAASCGLAACGGFLVSNLGEAPAVDPNAVAVVDRRRPEQKESRVDAHGAVAVLGDENVRPPAIGFLTSALASHRKGISKLQLELDELAIIDVFPKRSAIGMQAAMSGAFASMGYGFAETGELPADGDSIVCLFAGSLNGRPFKVTAHAPYEASRFAGSVRNDPAFVAAVKAAIENAAVQALRQTNLGKR